MICCGTTDPVTKRLGKQIIDTAVYIATELRKHGVTQDLTCLGHGQVHFTRAPFDIKPCPGRSITDFLQSVDWHTLLNDPQPDYLLAHHPDFIAAVQSGITNGDRPADFCTRAEAGIMAYRAKNGHAA